MTGDDDRAFEIIQKSLTTSHLQMPEPQSEPPQSPQESPPSAPMPTTDGEQ